MASFKSHTCCLQWLSLHSRRTETKQRCLKKVQNFKQSAGFCSCRHTRLKKTLFLMPICSAVTSKNRLSLNPKALFNLKMTPLTKTLYLMLFIKWIQHVRWHCALICQSVTDAKLFFVICLCDTMVTFISVCDVTVFRLQVHFRKHQHINSHRLQ